MLIGYCEYAAFLWLLESISEEVFFFSVLFHYVGYFSHTCNLVRNDTTDLDYLKIDVMAQISSRLTL